MENSGTCGTGRQCANDPRQRRTGRSENQSAPRCLTSGRRADTRSAQGSSKVVEAASPKAVSPAKYLNPKTGKTWAGRGRAPKCFLIEKRSSIVVRFVAVSGTYPRFFIRRCWILPPFIQTPPRSTAVASARRHASQRAHDLRPICGTQLRLRSGSSYGPTTGGPMPQRTTWDIQQRGGRDVLRYASSSWVPWPSALSIPVLKDEV
ncbi:MAG: hypothetical protein CL858_27895 [Cupriavidus sp.]|uniref:H-NS family nucleoid-associated regulatory protein n=1 Tax=Cupriavidus TaxID=106589 RepID=UPI000C464309|nr:hypothetical protein [Cupriavidus sp.]MCM3609478.1 H-NS histone family protein [Cupriavidus pauculus]